MHAKLTVRIQQKTKNDFIFMLFSYFFDPDLAYTETSAIGKMEKIDYFSVVQLCFCTCNYIAAWAGRILEHAQLCLISSSCACAII
jgi:hypothetical protein